MKSNINFILPRKQGSQTAVGLNQMIEVTLMNSSGIRVCGIGYMEEDNMYTEVIV